MLLRKDYEVLARERGYFGNFGPFGDFDLIFGAAKQISRSSNADPLLARLTPSAKPRSLRDGWLLLKMVWFAYRKLKAI